jgi:hypothetical protein
LEEDGSQGEDDLPRWRPLRLRCHSFIAVSCDFDPQHIFLRITNKSPSALSQFAIALNKNALGLELSEKPRVPEYLEFGDSVEIAIAVRFSDRAVGLL